MDRLMMKNNLPEKDNKSQIQNENVSNTKTKQSLIKGPKDGNVLSVKFNGKGKQLFDNLKKTKLLMLISIQDNELCTGIYFELAADHALTHYSFTTFLIADEVYWHNLKTENFSQDQEIELKHQAEELGSMWLKRNSAYFLKLLNVPPLQAKEMHETRSTSEIINEINALALKNNLNFELVRWHEWVHNDKTSFPKLKSEIARLYQTEPTLTGGIEASALSYANRHSSTQKADICLANSKAYLIEESPAVIWIAARLNYNFIVYAGDMLNAFKATRDYFIRDDKNFNQALNKELFIQVRNPKLLINWLITNYKKEYSEDEKACTSNDNNIKIKPAITINQYYSDANSFTYFRSSNSSTTVSDCFYGITKAIFDLPIDQQLKIDTIVDVTKKLFNTYEMSINRNPAQTCITINFGNQ